MKTKQETLTIATSLFQEKMGLNLNEVVVLENDKFKLKMELIVISRASMLLELTQEQHGIIADLIEFIQIDNQL